MNTSPKPTNKFKLSKAGICQCQACGELQPDGRKNCKYCNELIDLDYYRNDLIPTANCREIRFGLDNTEITLFKSAS